MCMLFNGKMFIVYFSVSVTKILCICIYLTVMTGLYISPLFIKSPCVIDSEKIPDKPKIIAHRGAPVVRFTNSNFLGLPAPL